MGAGTLRCPSCGAPAAADATQCTHCKSKLATIACAKCFGMVFVGSSFCPHCGTRAAKPKSISDEPLGPCPRCRGKLQDTQIGETLLHLCDRCAGIWIDAPALEAICADRERESAVLTTKLPPPLPNKPGTDRMYINCPQCNQLMNRLNYARCSGVVVDICKQHGVWLDHDELHRIVLFIRAGGLDHSRQLQMDQLRAKQSQLEQTMSQSTSGRVASLETDEDLPFASLAMELLGGLLRFSVR
jgi:Zn-finger nucleic acid-binding protein